MKVTKSKPTYKRKPKVTLLKTKPVDKSLTITYKKNKLDIPSANISKVRNAVTSETGVSKLVEKPVPKKMIRRFEVQSKKNYQNIDLAKDFLDKSIGMLGRTILGSLALAGFIGILQFYTKVMENGIPSKHLVMLTIASFLLGTLLSKD